MSDQKPQTRAVRIQAEVTQHREHSVPIFATSSFVFDDSEEMRAAFAGDIDRNIYSRFTNPNVAELSEKIAHLEGAEAGHSTATGMAAVFSTFGALLSSGDHILACRSLFGSTHTILTKILPRWGISHTYIDALNPDAWPEAVQDNTKLIFVETPTNPAVDLVDLERLSALAKESGAILAVDNCFATPVLQRPIDYGAHLSIHSATKFIDGQGRVMGGVVVGDADLVKEIFDFCRATGPALSPFNAWVLSKSVETLALRMEKHSENALVIAKWLERQSGLSAVRYPFLPSHPQYEVAKRQMSGGGAVLAFTLDGGLAQGKRFLDAIEMCSMTANLGDTRTIVSHPSSTTHAKLSEEESQAVRITPGLVRISVGLEDPSDIIADVEQALERSRD
ncbi:MAG: aminotransferase class I/II-fold pyridoxal phosphate-dependent enzyme [Gemmatimonadota bacterium]|nr:aminotransferase class I/II-fold pyridoxal phosphate-dependent enzyme [Gemmatimonadota bacterium]